MMMPAPLPTLLTSGMLRPEVQDDKHFYGKIGWDKVERGLSVETEASTIYLSTTPSTLTPCPSPTASSCGKEGSPDAPLASQLIVRNTFLDFANECRQNATQRRRARSLDVARTTSLADDAECTIANVGVGSGSADVRYHVGKSLETLAIPVGSVDLQENAVEVLVEEHDEQVDDVPSIGSIGHRIGNCVPCGYFWKSQGCLNGSRCEYCHLCDSREKKRRQKAKKQFLKTKA